MAEPGPLCIYEKRDPHIAIIKLNRPEKKNPSAAIFTGRSTKRGTKPKMTMMSGRSSSPALPTHFASGGDLKENIAFARGEMTGPRSGRAAYSNTAPAADAQADHRRNQWLRRRRWF